MGKRILLAVFISFVVIGLLFTGFGFALGGHYGFFTVQNGSLVYEETGGDVLPLGHIPGLPTYLRDPPAPLQSLITDDADPVSVPVDINLASATTVSIEISAGYVTVVPGDELGLTVDGPLPYTTSLKNGKWHIQSEHSDISFRNRRFYRGTNDITTTFTIVVPTQLQKLEISLDIGELEVGAIEVTEKAELSTSMGSMTVNGLITANLSLGTDMGSINATNMQADVCSITTNMGSVDFRGEITKELEAECNMGRIDVRLPRPSTYGWDVDVSMGSVSIDGQQYRDNSRSGKKENGLYFDLDCSMGSIAIHFT